LNPLSFINFFLLSGINVIKQTESSVSQLNLKPVEKGVSPWWRRWTERVLIWCWKQEYSCFRYVL